MEPIPAGVAPSLKRSEKIPENLIGAEAGPIAGSEKSITFVSEHLLTFPRYNE